MLNTIWMTRQTGGGPSVASRVDERCTLPVGLAAGFDARHDRRRFHVTARDITLMSAEMSGNDELATLRPPSATAPRPNEVTAP